MHLPKIDTAAEFHILLIISQQIPQNSLKKTLPELHLSDISVVLSDYLKLEWDLI